jgi:glycosyltransferase involved in cell wall biosynthesis
MKFSYIIAYRNSADRIKNITAILKWISKFDCEIIIVESDQVSNLTELKKEFNFNHIFLENNYPFNKSWCFNVGWKNAKTDRIVFGDADLIMEDNELINSVNLLEQYECVNPYSSVIDLEELETKEYLDTINFESLKSIQRSGRGEEDHQKVPMCGGIIMFKKEALEKIEGWNEDFWGWGAEDDCMSIKCKLFLRNENVKAKCYHLFHQKAPVVREFYFRNLQIYNYFLNLKKEDYQPYFNSIKGKIGLINKINLMKQ